MHARAHEQAVHVGRSVPRVEDRPLLVGAGRFLDDIDRPGRLHARVVRSDAAHARFLSITTARARSGRGVVDVVTADDLPDVRILVRMMPSHETEAVTQPPSARGRVRYVGEPIAVVVATDAYAAEDAGELIEVDLDELDPVLERSAFARLRDEAADRRRRGELVGLGLRVRRGGVVRPLRARPASCRGPTAAATPRTRASRRSARACARCSLRSSPTSSASRSSASRSSTMTPTRSRTDWARTRAGRP